MNSLIFSLYKHMILIDLWLNMFLSATYVLHILKIGDQLQLLYWVYSLSGSILKPSSYVHLCKTAFPIPISLHFSNEEKEGKKRDWSFKLVWWFYTMEHSHFYYAHHQYVCLSPAYGQFPTNYLVFDNASKREVYGERIKSSGFLNVRIISIGFAKRYKNDWSFFMASSFKW